MKHLGITRSQVFVLDQDVARDFYVDTLGLEVADDLDLGFMRWLTVRVPGDPGREILLERPGPPAMDEHTAEQVRDLLTKGAVGGWLSIATAGSTSPMSRRRSPTGSTSGSAIRSATPSGSASCSTPRPGDGDGVAPVHRSRAGRTDHRRRRARRGRRRGRSADRDTPPTVGAAATREAFTLLGAVPFAGPVLSLIAGVAIGVGASRDPDGRGFDDRLASGTRILHR